MKYSFIHESTVRVRYSETDRMGYCYYGNYAHYFEIGRVEALRSLGISYKALEDSGIMLPVSEYNVKYLSPSFYDDVLSIKTHLSEIKGARIYFDYTILNSDFKVIASAQTVLVFVSHHSMRPTGAPDLFTKLLHSYEISK
jgi:acyl-CoA thioester hydrolase